MKINIRQKENNFKNEFEIFYNNELKYIAKVPSVSIDNPLKIDDIRKIKVNDLNNNVIYTANYNYSLKKNNKYSSFKFLLTGEQAFNQLLFVTKNKSIKIYYEENYEFGCRYVIDVNNKQYYCYLINDGYIRHFPIFYREKQVAEILKSNIDKVDEYYCYIQKEYKMIRDGVALLTLYLDRSEYNSIYVKDINYLELSESSLIDYDKDWVKYNFDCSFFDKVDEAVALLKKDEKQLKKVKKTKTKKEKIVKKQTNKNTDIKNTEEKKEIDSIDVVSSSLINDDNVNQDTTEITEKEKKKRIHFPKLKPIKIKKNKPDEEAEVTNDNTVNQDTTEIIVKEKKKRIHFPKLKPIKIKKNKPDKEAEITNDVDAINKVIPEKEIKKKELDPFIAWLGRPIIIKKKKIKKKTEEVTEKNTNEEIDKTEEITNKRVRKKLFFKLRKTSKNEEKKNNDEDFIEEIKTILDNTEVDKNTEISEEINEVDNLVEEENKYEDIEFKEETVKKVHRKFSFPKMWITSIFLIIILLLVSYFVNEYRIKLEKEREEAKKNEKVVTGNVEAKILSIDDVKISKDDTNNKLQVEGKMKLSFSEEKYYDVTIWGYCLGDENEKYIIYGPDNEEKSYHDGNHKFTLVNTVNSESGDVIYKDGTTKKFNDIEWDNVRIKYCKIDKIVSYSKLKDGIIVKTTKVLKFDKEIK